MPSVTLRANGSARPTTCGRSGQVRPPAQSAVNAALRTLAPHEPRRFINFILSRARANVQRMRRRLRPRAFSFPLKAHPGKNSGAKRGIPLIAFCTSVTDRDSAPTWSFVSHANRCLSFYFGVLWRVFYRPRGLIGEVSYRRAVVQLSVNSTRAQPRPTKKNRRTWKPRQAVSASSTRKRIK